MDVCVGSRRALDDAVNINVGTFREEAIERELSHVPVRIRAVRPGIVTGSKHVEIANILDHDLDIVLAIDSRRTGKGVGQVLRACILGVSSCPISWRA